VTDTYRNIALLAWVIGALVVSGVGPVDRATWVLEVAPVVIGVPLLVAVWRRFPLTSLVCLLLAVHATILMIGGHYSYAKVPLGFWLQEWFDLGRNHYDRVGHLAQGFVPAMLVREILLRRSPLKPGKWLFFLVTCVCLSISVVYEFIEWWTALALGADADAFLATQGDPWDTQWDMFLAMIGAVAAQLLLARLHDRDLKRLKDGD
jgi:putative membrane protein